MLACKRLSKNFFVWRLAKQRAEELRSNGKVRSTETRADFLTKFVKITLAFLYLNVYNNECATAQMKGAGKLFLSVLNTQ